MKGIKILMLFAFLLSGLILNAQTKEDSLAIEKACRDYVEGWAEGDMERVANGISQELVKRSIAKDKEGVCFTTSMSPSHLKFATKRNKKDGVRVKDLEPDKNFKLQVIIYDICGDYATAKASNTKYGFFDYCQLAKFNGEWKIFNVMWGWLPPNN